MSSQTPESLEQQVQALSQENRALRAEIDKIQHSAERRSRILRGGVGLLIPLLDRQRVARSFAKLTGTVSNLAGPQSGWPSRSEIIADAREFMTSCVRFAVRRRMIVFLFSVVAVAIPALQMWLVLQQNEMIKNQNEFFEIQIYDVVSRSMTEGDRNARQMTGALLANTNNVKFLKGIIAEAFDPTVGDVAALSEGAGATERRLEDAAFRGHLIHATVRMFQRQGGEKTMSAGAAYEHAVPMFQDILEDSERRLPQIFQKARSLPDENRDAKLAELIEQVDYYFNQVGLMLQVYGRIARSVYMEKAFFKAIAPLMKRLAQTSVARSNRFARPYRTALEEFVIETALEAKFGDPPVALSKTKLKPEQALRKGLDRLRAGLGEDALDWTRFEQFLEIQ